ncbi:hypothetical protein EDD86DRAFT_271554 [Gorgonomyces haynaldii]|nr:hypothetical protein EDD86DRAFT_271554 [Gorgonomyces haynaldii]
MRYCLAFSINSGHGMTSGYFGFALIELELFFFSGIFDFWDCVGCKCISCDHINLFEKQKSSVHFVCQNVRDIDKSIGLESSIQCSLYFERCSCVNSGNKFHSSDTIDLDKLMSKYKHTEYQPLQDYKTAVYRPQTQTFPKTEKSKTDNPKTDNRESRVTDQTTGEKEDLKLENPLTALGLSVLAFAVLESIVPYVISQSIGFYPTHLILLLLGSAIGTGLSQLFQMTSHPLLPIAKIVSGLCMFLVLVHYLVHIVFSFLYVLSKSYIGPVLCLFVLSLGTLLTFVLLVTVLGSLSYKTSKQMHQMIRSVEKPLSIDPPSVTALKLGHFLVQTLETGSCALPGSDLNLRSFQSPKLPIPDPIHPTAHHLHPSADESCPKRRWDPISQTVTNQEWICLQELCSSLVDLDPCRVGFKHFLNPLIHSTSIQLLHLIL